MASTKSRLIRLLSGTRTVVDGIPSFDTAVGIKAKDLTPRRIEGDYEAEDYVTGQEGAQGDRLSNLTMGLDFMVDAATSGTAGTAPIYGDLLRGCGLKETVVADTSVSYSLQPLGEEKHEVALQYLDSQSMQVTENARGALTFSAEVRNKPMFGFQFMGAHYDGQDPIAPPVDFAAWRDAPDCSPDNMEAITLGGTKLCVQSFSFTDGRTPRRNKFMNCDDTDITARNITGRMVVRMPPASDIDLLGLAKAGTKEAFVWQMGNQPGETLRIAAPAVQVKYAGEQDIDGEIGLSLDLVFVFDQGGDEIAISYL